MSPVKEPGYFASEIRAETLSEPLLRHVALQSREFPKVLNDGENRKPSGWIAGPHSLPTRRAECRTRESS